MDSPREEVCWRERERVSESFVFVQTVEWAHGNMCEKCGIPFFWNVKEMWNSKTIGVRQVRN